MDTLSHPQDRNSALHPLAGYYSDHSRLPRQSGEDRDAAEKKAGNLLRAVRRRAQGEGGGAVLDAALREWLDINVPGWLTDEIRPAARSMRGVRSFKNQAHKAKRFYDHHGRVPSAAAPNQQEAAIGRFLRNHRQALQGRGTNSWSAGKELMLDRAVPGWDLGTRARMTTAAVAVAI